jgi:1,4-dihydroxy-2-naphthoyl-CoA hydrolase
MSEPTRADRPLQPHGPVLPGREAIPFDECLDGRLGFRIDELGPDRARGSVQVTNVVRQRFGLVHGGTYAAFAEMLASEATVAEVYPSGLIGVGLSNESKFLRPVTSGSITATATCLHRGRTTWVWDVEFTDERGRKCAASRVTIAVRERREDRPGQL